LVVISEFASTLFGMLIQTGSRAALFIGYLIAALLMIGAAIVELRLGVEAERRTLVDIATPLSASEKSEVRSER
jgi:hypothetical protein